MGEIIDAKVTPIEETNEVKTEKTWKEKVGETFDLVVKKTGPTIHKVAENLGWIVPAIGLTASGIGALASIFGKSKDELCLVEDDFTGEHVMTKRPLTNDNILDMTELLKSDAEMTKAEALNEMGLLRKEKRRKI